MKRVKLFSLFVLLVLLSNRVFGVLVSAVVTLLTFTLSFSTVLAQTSINTAGEDAFGSGGSVSYSVGQVFYLTHISANGSIAEGVQQSYIISEVTEEPQGIKAFPNPTTDYLILSIGEFDISNLEYQLYDIKGQLLRSDKITNNSASIDVSALVPATYFLKIVQGKKELKIFKIIKN